MNNEVGYTPSNLKGLLKDTLPEMTRPRDYVASVLDVTTNTVDRWCVGLDSNRHVDMPYTKWKILYDHLITKKGSDMDSTASDYVVAHVNHPPR